MKDADKFPVPLPYKHGIFFANETCISVLAMHEPDGQCKISRGRVAEIAAARDPDFQQTIDVPNRKVIVMLVPRAEVLALQIFVYRAAISIWMTDPVYADEVVIGIEQLADERRSA